MRYLFLAIFLTACSHGKHDEQPVRSKTGQLEDKFLNEKLALKLSPEKDLYPHPQDCDYTLWAGEAAAAGTDVALASMEYAPGEIHRRPKAEGECYPKGAVSKVSNDMLTGYMAGAWERKDLKALQRLADYGEAHHWFMGDPEDQVGDVVLKEPLIGLLGRMLHKLSSGADARPYRTLMPVYTHVSDDYAQHVQAAQILYQGEVGGLPLKLAIDDEMLKRLKESASEHPDNYFFASALAVYDGSYDHAIDMLLRADPGVPSYVRGERADVYQRVHWLFATWQVLKHEPKEPPQ